tara:strand:- start:1694 stop:1885 length:192 start_codon:yes stop_codon:yes gene_type:complete
MKLYIKKEELDLIQRIAYLSETKARFETLGNKMTEVQFKKYAELSEEIYNLAKKLEKINDSTN